MLAKLRSGCAFSCERPMEIFFSDFAENLGGPTNPLYQLHERLKAVGAKLTDLVRGNVNEHGIVYPPHILAEILKEAAETARVYRPDSLGQRPARDVIIEIKSASVGWVDLLMTSGQYQHMQKPPYTPGLEYAGVVAWAGHDARGVAVGDEVLVDPFLAGPRSLGAYQAYGGFASWAVARSRRKIASVR